MTFYLFSPKTYADRRAALMATMGKGVILIKGNGYSPVNYAGNHYRFRQDSSFLYYAGIDLPGLDLIMDVDNNRVILYGDEQSVSDQVWSGARESLKSLAGKVGIDTVKPGADLIPDFANCDILCLPPYRAEHFVLLQKINEHADCSVAPSVALIQAVIAQREIKTAEEIGQIEEALVITREMHVKVMQSAKPGIREALLTGIAEGVAIANQSTTAYGTILTRNGETLHNEYYDNILKDGDLVLGDFGAESRMRYASDITRTFPVSKKFTTQQRELYELVLNAEEKGIAAVKPGVRFRDIHLDTARLLTEGLKAIGLMQGDTEEAVAAGAHALFFPHGLGHMIGLDVHDMEGLGEDRVGYDDQVTRSEQFGFAYLRMAKTLRPGHVVTVEPGLYFIPGLIASWKQEKKHEEFINYDTVLKYDGFGGIRIEDNVLVTEKGHRILGPGIPKSVKEVEALRES
jgi:Xaa-Pro aminopeptidase